MNKNENQALLDLCTLNQLEEHSVGTEEDQTEWQQAIKHSKRRVMYRIRAKLPPVDPSAEQDHLYRNHAPDCAIVLNAGYDCSCGR